MIGLELLAATVIAAGSALHAGAVQAQVFPNLAPPGASVEVDVSGLAPGESYMVLLDGTSLGLLPVEADATSSALTVQIPADVPPGGQTLLIDDPSGAAVASAALTITGQQAAEILDQSFPSRALAGPLRFAVYLPPGYASGGSRYPVIYFLHGLPATGTSYRSWMSFVDSAMAAVADKAIVVVPQGARTGDSDPEYLDWAPSRNWETALSSELPAYVDAHFSTIPDRRARALIGVSAGGYGAFAIGLHHLARFAAVESWSGYFAPTDPEGRKQLDLGSATANARATLFAAVRGLPRLLRANPTFIGFYVGAQDDFTTVNVRLDGYLSLRGVPHAFAVYPGGHTTSLWAAQAPAWISAALRTLAPPH